MASGKVISQLSVKTKTFNGTTNANGNLMLPLSVSDIVLELQLSAGTEPCIGVIYRTVEGSVVHVCRYTADTPSVTMTSITGTIYYL